ncbi:MAG TPA: protease complex subunit PrcB family protein, partial [Candidatus Saccharimonadia bacterium]|nr:protease complex subunit PrcB family protein [Candidatus Saccharimonadia bacterium]
MLSRFGRPRWWQLGVSLVLAAIVAIWITAGYTEPIDSYTACVTAGYPVFDSNPPVCRAGSRNFTGLPSPTPTPPAPVTSVPFEILVDGDTHSPVPGHDQQLITTQSQWQTYWRSVHGGLPTLPPILPVDFSSSSVIGTSLGAKPTGGYSLKITSITTGSAGSVIDVTESTPTITCLVTQSITNRYLIVRTDTPLKDPVSFRIT